MFKFADNCTEALLLSREAFFGLFDNYNKLEDEAHILEDTLAQAKFEKKQAVGKAEQEKNKRVVWKRVAIGEGILIVGAITGVITGAWVPVVAVVAASEVAIILNKEAPKVSAKNLFFKP
jgi:hypothetical protein